MSLVPKQRNLMSTMDRERTLAFLGLNAKTDMQMKHLFNIDAICPRINEIKDVNNLLSSNQ